MNKATGLGPKHGIDRCDGAIGQARGRRRARSCEPVFHGGERVIGSVKRIIHSGERLVRSPERSVHSRAWTIAGHGGPTAHDMLRRVSMTGEKGPWSETASATIEA